MTLMWVFFWLGSAGAVGYVLAIVYLYAQGGRS